jgi:A/G-specific adenine glycosylase
MTEIEELDNLLLEWHKHHHRDYPWRKDISPYKIMIAEFMLQRTKADQVVPIYIKFIKNYPDVYSLSISNERDIQAILKPLGLYWRASHFKKAAECIIKQFDGIIPSTEEELLHIPGIGNYVAGAILTVAFSKNACVIDSNIARVLNRFFYLGLTGEIRRKNEIKKLSCQIFNSNNPGKVLFAILDFSALICTPKNPKHDVCPLRNKCRCYKQNKCNNR